MSTFFLVLSPDPSDTKDSVWDAASYLGSEVQTGSHKMEKCLYREPAHNFALH